MLSVVQRRYATLTDAGALSVTHCPSASLTVVRRPNLDRFRPSLGGVGQNWQASTTNLVPTSIQFGPSSSKFDSIPTTVAKVRPTLDRFRLKFGRLRSNLAEFDQVWDGLDQVCSSLADFDRICAEFDRCSIDLVEMTGVSKSLKTRSGEYVRSNFRELSGRLFSEAGAAKCKFASSS